MNLAVGEAHGKEEWDRAASAALEATRPPLTRRGAIMQLRGLRPRLNSIDRDAILESFV